jgi:hypothetical protein
VSRFEPVAGPHRRPVARRRPNPNPITLVGLRKYSSPLCNPLTGTGCSPDGIPVFSSIFSEDTIGNSNYNSLQIGAEKRSIAGLQFQAAYTLSKSIDDASSFESLLDPLNYRASRAISLFGAHQRLVFSYEWELPHPRGRGLFAGALKGWSTSGILTLQSGFPHSHHFFRRSGIDEQRRLYCSRRARHGGAVAQIEPTRRTQSSL